MNRYLITYISALIIEVCSTFYIRVVSQGNIEGMIFFAMIAPYLGLPFISYMVETKTWTQRINYAMAMSLGYGSGTALVIVFGL